MIVFSRILHHNEFSKEDELDDINKEYEYDNVESFDPNNNAYKKVEPPLENPDQNYNVDDQYSYSEYGQEDKQIHQNPNSKQMNRGVSKQNLCNPNDETLSLIRKLNGETDSYFQNCDEKKMRAINLIRAINGNGNSAGSLEQYQSDNGNGILSKIFNFARNLPNIYR